jgi:hypothetical protein
VIRPGKFRRTVRRPRLVNVNSAGDSNSYVAATILASLWTLALLTALFLELASA